MIKLLYHPLTISLLTVGAGWLSWSLYSSSLQMKGASGQLRVLEQENTEIARDVSRLKYELHEAQSEYSQERIIRNELLMQKPGEYVVPVSLAAESSSSATLPSPTPTVWQEWWELVVD